jgi:hypothetical protein
MKYLCLIYQDERIWERMPKDEAGRIYAEYFAFTGETKKSGSYISGNPLQPTRTARTVSVRDGEISVTDGPFAETKEQLGGYFLIEAENIEDAVKVAARIPGARLGRIEVRPVMETSDA